MANTKPLSAQKRVPPLCHISPLHGPRATGLLTEYHVRRILELRAKGMRIEDIACFVHKSIATVKSVCAGETDLYVSLGPRVQNKFDLDFCRAYAKQHGGLCLSSRYENNKQPLIWMCAKGHLWPRSLRQLCAAENGWCPDCEGKTLYVNDYCIIWAWKRGGEVLSKQRWNSRNENFIYEWSCVRRHTWKRSFAETYTNDLWCSECVPINEQSWTMALCHLVAHQNSGGKCLSTVVRFDCAMMWQCSRKHTFFACLEYVLRGWWCTHNDCIITPSSIANNAKTCTNSITGMCSPFPSPLEVEPVQTLMVFAVP